jgi:hypothetical protein
MLRITWTRVLAIVSLVCLMLLLTAAPIAAKPDGNGKGHKDGDNDDPPALVATPELDSLALFGVGATGLLGYALLRVRASRRGDDQDPALIQDDEP